MLATRIQSQKMLPGVTSMGTGISLCMQVDGYLHEQPPQRVKDFVRQRSRWLSGIRAVLRDRKIPFGYRLCLGIFTGLWQIAIFAFLDSGGSSFCTCQSILLDAITCRLRLGYIHLSISTRHRHTGQAFASLFEKEEDRVILETCRLLAVSLL